MAWDYRKYSGWERHPKFIAVRERYGAEGMLGVDFLWGYAAEYKPKGVLTKMTKVGICHACQVDPSNIEYVDFLVEVRLLDLLEDGVTYAIHNWEARQPNCYNREKIKEQKVAAANARHAKNRAEKEKKEARKAKRNQKAKDDSAGAVQPHVQMQCPNPTQPNHKKDSLSISLTTDQPSEGERARELFFTLVRESQPKAVLKNPAAWTGMLQSLVDAGQTVEDIERVTQWAMQDRFWCSRILSPKAFADNYSTIAIQMAGEQTVHVPSNEQDQSKGMSAEEWERTKKAKAIHVSSQVNKVNAMPP